MKTKCKECDKRILGYNQPNICKECEKWEDWGNRNILNQRETLSLLIDKFIISISIIILLALIILIIK